MSSFGELTFRDDYMLASAALNPFDTGLSSQTAEDLRTYLAEDYFPSVSEQLPGYSTTENRDDKTVQKFAFSLGPSSDPRTHDLTHAHFTAVRSIQAKDRWSLRYAAVKYRMFAEPGRIAVRHLIDVDQGIVTLAKVEARIISCDSDSFFNLLLTDPNQPITESVDYTRNIYERPLEPKDCFKIRQGVLNALLQALEFPRRRRAIPLV